MQVRLTPYGLDALQRAYAQAPEVARGELLAAATEATLLLQSDVVGRYPAHTGGTRSSIGADAFSTPTGVLGVVGSSQPVAAFIELGTRPHTPPLQPLLLWVADVLGKTGPEGFRAALGIQRKIARRGTRARPLFSQALQRHQAAIGRMFEDAAGRLAAQLGGGAA